MTNEEITVVEWLDCRTGKTLRAFATLELPSGMLLRDCSYHKLVAAFPHLSEVFAAIEGSIRRKFALADAPCLGGVQ